MSRIHNSGIGMAVWNRKLDAGLTGWLKRLPPARLPDGRVLVSVENARAAIRSILDAGDTPDSAYRRIFENDVVGLVRRFGRLADTKLVDVRLERIATDACWKFHLDNVPLRLLTTYRGQTTQWIEGPHEVAALKQQRSYTGPMRHLTPYAVAIFKGKQAAGGEGVLHRSPPIAGSGETRLFLCLNLPSEVSPDLWLKPKCRKVIAG